MKAGHLEVPELFTAAVEEGSARRLFDQASRLVRAWRALTSAGAARDGWPLEMVRLPVAVASTRHDPIGGAEGEASPGRRRLGPPRRVPRPLRSQRPHRFVVERILGHAWAVSCDPVTVEDAGRNDAAGALLVLPARLTKEDCRKPVEALASRAALTFGRARTSDLVELEPIRDSSYPFWLRYRRDRRGRVEFDALDAVTGRRAGGPLRAALAAGLIDADRLSEVAR